MFTYSDLAPFLRYFSSGNFFRSLGNITNTFALYASDLSLVHLHKTVSPVETLQALWEAWIQYLGQSEPNFYHIIRWKFEKIPSGITQIWISGYTWLTYFVHANSNISLGLAVINLLWSSSFAEIVLLQLSGGVVVCGHCLAGGHGLEGGQITCSGSVSFTTIQSWPIPEFRSAVHSITGLNWNTTFIANTNNTNNITRKRSFFVNTAETIYYI